MKKIITLCVCALGLMAPMALQPTAQAAHVVISTGGSHHGGHRVWIKGHHAWRHHHRVWVPGHYIWR